MIVLRKTVVVSTTWKVVIFRAKWTYRLYISYFNKNWLIRKCFELVLEQWSLEHISWIWCEQCDTYIGTVWYIYWNSVVHILEQCDTYIGTVWYIYWDSVVHILEQCDTYIGTVWYIYIIWNSVVHILEQCDTYIGIVWYIYWNSVVLIFMDFSSVELNVILCQILELCCVFSSLYSHYYFQLQGVCSKVLFFTFRACVDNLVYKEEMAKMVNRYVKSGIVTTCMDH